MEKRIYRNLGHRIQSAINHNYYRLQHALKMSLPGGSPMGAMVELTNMCNLKCVLCPSGNGDLQRKTGFMDEVVFQKIVDELDDTYIRDLIPAMWGESIIHPKFIEFMRYARKKTWRISLSTNGNKKGDDQYFKDLVDSGIDEIVCAVDGHNQESYENYRKNGKLDVVHDFLGNIRKARETASVSHPYLVAQIHLFSSNEEHLDDIRKNVIPFVDEVRTKKTRTFYTDQTAIKNIEDLRKKLKPQHEELQFVGGRPSCPTMMHTVNINWEGEVISCCRDPNTILKFGNVREHSIKSILTSKKYVEAKRRLFAGDFWVDVCRDCYKV
ncbi:MAG: radical SAM protein [Proteobacteria bacterium]|nr:radical SAM protein [Pseudomonadota bacterium]